MKVNHFAVIGDPIAHSLSPIMYRAALAKLGLPHTYEAIRVESALLPATLDRLRRGNLHGINVTVPHKIEALKLCDFSTDEVAITGAVNTLFIDATGRLVGSNTDVDGLRADLLAEGIVPKKALVIGTGGAARAAVLALSQLDCDVTVSGRDPQAADRVVKQTLRGKTAPWILPSGPYDLVVNATSAGMSGAGDGLSIADAWDRAEKHSDAIAYDLVYRPSRTEFLLRAESQGHRAICGAGMLVEQGARALSIFIGTPIDVAVKRVMREAVDAAIDAETGSRPGVR